MQSRRPLLITAVITGVAALVAQRASAPIALEPGSAEELWEVATGLPYARGVTGAGGVLPASGSRFAFFSRRGRGYDVYGVPSGGVARLLPRVLQDLAVGYRVGALRPAVAAGYGRWAVSTTARSTRDSIAAAALLVRYLYDAELEASLEDFPSAASDLRLRAMDARERWERAERVWITAGFEVAFLTGWLLFVAWPWLRGAGATRWALHFGLAPLLLYLPHALGYAPAVFHARPSGGLVYPALIVLFLLPALLFPRTPLDVVARNELPDVLEPLNQVPTTPATWLSPSVGLGPTGVILYGLALAALVYLLRRRAETHGPAPG